MFHIFLLVVLAAIFVMEVSRLKTQDSCVKNIPPKKRSPLILLMVILLSATVAALYILLIYTRQSNIFGQPKPLETLKIDHRNAHLCPNTSIQGLDSTYFHFPHPKTFDRQECACNPVVYFAIVSMQRSGSGWFETLLNSHINLSSNGEIFGARERRSNVSMILKILDQVYNLDWVSSASKNECTAAVGFKWMLNQGLMEYNEDIADYLRRRGVSIIFLLRRNLLRRMISLLANSFDKEAKPLNGTHKSHVHSQHEAQILARYKPTLNITRLLSNLNSAAHLVAKALQCFNDTRHILLYYEDLLTNPRKKLIQVQEFLKLPIRNMSSGQVQIHSGPLSALITNFPHVRETLRGTSFQNFTQL